MVQMAIWFITVIMILLVASVFLVPLVVLPLVSVYKSRQYARAMKRIDVPEYSSPAGLLPAELGYIIDEKSGEWEILSSMLSVCAKKGKRQRLLSYEKISMHISANQVLSTLKNPFSGMSKYTIYYDGEDADRYIYRYKEALSQELLSKSVVQRGMASISKSKFSIVKISMILSAFVLPFWVLVLADVFGDNYATFLAAVMLVAFFSWVGMYLAVRVYFYARQKDSLVKEGSKGVDRVLWDEIRGYREFLKQVELPRIKVMVEARDKDYLKGRVFQELVAFGLVNPEQISAAFEVLDI